MAQALKDAEGNQLFTAEQFRARYSKELKELGYLFKWRKPNEIGPLRVSIWFSHLQEFLRLRHRVEIKKDEII